ncbi:DNA-binding protein [Ectopseudomonas hydrolytica]|uniref:DNA-binding protein n=1 Tax=Ectopseudomonas hydrolytica TaxID=2493633 RepID=A0ABY5AEN4_9GAMM|nr:DNA-binding protein [Pseudomonas hydrolytica]USR42017.1 DNA-binding protein [Pseudomonas hydrolytica]
MARGGINKAIVQKARNALLARGIHPSIDAVRIELGNTGSKTTIHRYLKELESVEQAISSDVLSTTLTGLIEQLLDQLKQEAQQSVAQAHKTLLRERAAVHQQSAVLEARMRDLESQCSGLTLQLQAAQELTLQEQQQRQAVEVDNARMVQSLQDLQVRVRERDERIQSLEDMHQHARDGMEHYRQASKEQREQEQRRHETQTSQLQVEIRQLQQTLMIKQDELTQLNRDNARLVTEARQHQKDQHALEQLLALRDQALESAQSTLTDMEHTNDTLERQCQALRGEVAQFDEACTAQTQQVQNLQERLAEITDQLKLLAKVSPPENELAP